MPEIRALSGMTAFRRFTSALIALQLSPTSPWHTAEFKVWLMRVRQQVHDMHCEVEATTGGEDATTGGEDANTGAEEATEGGEEVTEGEEEAVG